MVLNHCYLLILNNLISEVFSCPLSGLHVDQVTVKSHMIMGYNNSPVEPVGRLLGKHILLNITFLDTLIVMLSC